MSSSQAKLQKSFQDYFRIPILLKPLGYTSQQTLSNIANILNQIDRFAINEDLFSSSEGIEPPSPQRNKKGITVQQRIKIDFKNRGTYQSQKLLFMSQDFNNDWSQFQVIYKTNFVILVYSSSQLSGNSQKIIGTANQGTKININETIQKMSVRLKQKDKKLLGIIFLNNGEQCSKQLTTGIKFTIVPPSLPLQQLSMFLQPWLGDLIPTIEGKLLQTILQCRQEENNIIVFNRSQQKSQPKIMKRKKKFRSLKISGDLALMLHLYQYAFQAYQQAQQQCKKVDDWLWALGCVQGKLACMTCNAQLTIQNVQKQIQELINQSFILSKKIKYQFFQIQNLFKILKLLLHQDRQRFDDMVELTLASSKGLTQDEKFIYYSYIGSLYQKVGMQRKRNAFYYKASLITQSFKPQISQVLLKTIKTSKYLKQWQYLNSKIIQKIISSQKYFIPTGQMHLELIQKCSSVLSKKQIQSTRDYLNFGNFKEIEIKQANVKLFELKDFSIEQSLIKPKLNRLVVDESPKKNQSGIFVGWKKKQTWLYQDQEPIIFKGTILNKLPFQIHIKIFISSVNNQNQQHQFSLVLPPYVPYKFKKQIAFKYCQQPIVVKKMKFLIWNFILYKAIQPQINFQLYQKQPNFQLQIEQSQKFLDQKQSQKEKYRIFIQQTSMFQLRCNLFKRNDILCQKLRITCSVYYDIDVGFQQNQFNFSSENKFLDIDLGNLNNGGINIKFVQSELKQCLGQYDKNNQILVCKLKKFKTSRNHIKKIQINLDYIKAKQSKYQINKQYVIQPKLTNSIQAQVVQISTPQLQATIKNLQNPTQFQLKQIYTNWNLIQEYYLIKIKISKDKYNLRPFKIWYKNNNEQEFVVGKNEVILSNLIEGEMWIRLKKNQISLEEKNNVLVMGKKEENHIQIKQIKKQQSSTPSIYQRTIHFQWQNIVNKNTYGSLNVLIKANPLMYSPKIQFQIKIEKLEKIQKSDYKYYLYELKYRIKSEKEHELKSHKVVIKPYSEHENYFNNSSQIAKNQGNLNKGGVNLINQNNKAINNENSTGINNEDDHTPINNTTILINGKTRVQRLHPIHIQKSHKKSTTSQIKQQQQKQTHFTKYYYENKLKLKIIKEDRQNQNPNKNPSRNNKIKCIIIVQFDEKELGKWQKIITFDSKQE